MAGFSSHDDLMNEITVNAKFLRVDWNKLALPTTAQVVGAWYSLFSGAGSPGAATVLGTGTNLAFQALDDTSIGAMLHGGNVSTDTKHILNASAYSASITTAPNVMMLVDLLGFYPITTVTSTSSQALNNTVTIPRYTTGAGVRAFVVPSTVMGAATPNISLPSYTNAAGTAGRATPTVLPVGNTASPVGQISYSGTGAGKYGPFMPLAAGDTGIRSVQNFQLSASYVSGVLNLVLCKPLITLPIVAQGIASERDFVNQLPSFPKIEDGACLAWLMLAGAATPVNSSISGHVEFGWG